MPGHSAKKVECSVAALVLSVAVVLAVNSAIVALVTTKAYHYGNIGSQPLSKREDVQLQLITMTGMQAQITQLAQDLNSTVRDLQAQINKLAQEMQSQLNKIMDSSNETSSKISSHGRGQPPYKGQSGWSKACPLFGGSTIQVCS